MIVIDHYLSQGGMLCSRKDKHENLEDYCFANQFFFFYFSTVSSAFIAQTRKGATIFNINLTGDITVCKLEDLWKMVDY